MVDENDCMILANDVTIYSTLDFNEFTSFVERFSAFELGKFKEMFDQFDDDGSGQLCTSETARLMASLGFTPLKSMIKEALEVVDKDNSGQMDFKEFIHLQAIYRSSEGFNRKDVGHLRSIYEDECQ